METDRKVRTAVNYYRKNVLKKYFQIWKKYSDHKQYLTGKSVPHNSYLDSKPGVQFDYEILNFRKNDNDQKIKEVVFPRIVNTNKHLDNDVKEKTIKLRNFITGRLWEKCSFIAINKRFSRTRNEKIIVEQSQKYNTVSRKNIIIAYSALLLFKIAWKIWYRYSNIIIEKKK
ncbi:uncharacterized protein LOC132952018 [Metopolophium dirhodum]|uniref:uncharacterized protein LOC132938504 n=1 Tax=Metopolophium dirhodum TaxID=44670 RepID=UPI0029901976|nr:uncharacterized protein LOC132938504 [Metopolophium dirhodum]XP_060880114.1 uncharacterized protein LOC132952018 [Metopolophium dirhodum]